MTDPVTAELRMIRNRHYPDWREAAAAQLRVHNALLAVLELHKPYYTYKEQGVWCDADDCCDSDGKLIPYPCTTTQTVARELGVTL